VKGLNRLHRGEEMAWFNDLLSLYPQKPKPSFEHEIHAELRFNEYVTVLFRSE
jgi:hypothetical protein